MRKIEEMMVDAIKNGKNLCVSNTRVVCDGDERKVYLFGNLIAVVENSRVYVTDAGWSTTTTISRLHAILRAFKKKLLSRKCGKTVWADSGELLHKNPYCTNVLVEADNA